MNIEDAHNVSNLSVKSRANQRLTEIIAETPTLVGEGMRGHFRQKPTSGFLLFAGFFPEGLNFPFFQPKSSERKGIVRQSSRQKKTMPPSRNRVDQHRFRLPIIRESSALRGPTRKIWSADEHQTEVDLGVCNHRLLAGGTGRHAGRAEPAQ
ncbi:hypothetical protein [Pseudomonas sp. TH31]|uniref:hypothetical protein n=1 Tax=Pseudomonas sp. TH31 TaxID=2796396 RepID=UPI0019143CDE|nr:hypothetical protein [Pseudomonas sp. TH31]MBK5413506.1 hypothetical protein [Pseudomonas sp. TH31]